MPHSILMGRPWPAAGEPLFLDDDRDLALALVAEERDRCPGCGEPLTVSLAATSEEAYRAEAVRCHGCAAQSRATSSVDDHAGLLVEFTRRPNPGEEPT